MQNFTLFGSAISTGTVLVATVQPLPVAAYAYATTCIKEGKKKEHMAFHCMLPN